MSRGYTLVEILVSIAIFVILLGAVVMSFHGVNNTDRMKADGQILISAAREARNAAFNGIADNTGTYPVGGYGLYFERVNATTPITSFVLFADKDGDFNYNPQNETVRVYTLKSSTKAIFTKNATPSTSKVTVIFNGSNYPQVYDVTNMPIPAQGQIPAVITTSCSPSTVPPCSRALFVGLQATDTVCNIKLYEEPRLSGITDPLSLQIVVTSC